MERTIEGFRNYDGKNSVIRRVLESRTLRDHGESEEPGLVALLIAGKSYKDRTIRRIASDLPDGQSLWVFSPQLRKISHENIFRLQHVPAKNNSEFELKVSTHLERVISSQPEGSKFVPSRLPFPETLRVHIGIDAYEPLLDTRHVAKVIEDKVPFEFFSDLRTGSDKLVVFGQDALTRTKVSLPHFFRWKWSHRINASVLILNDPSLYLDDSLDGAWWIGSPERDYVTEATQIILKAARSLNLGSEDILFVGMSAGGHSAMHMAAVTPGSTAMVDIPRMTLRAPGARGKTADAAVTGCLGFASALDVPEDLLYRIDAFERIKKTGHLPPFVYLQNMLDEKHLETQYRMFRDSVTALPQFDPSKQQFVEYSQWNLTKGGHFPLKEPVIIRFIHQILQGNYDFPESLSTEDITAD